MEEDDVSRTVIDLDDEALDAAAIELGTTTKRDTVNTALREVADRNRRARAWAELQKLTADGGLDLDLLADKKRYRP
jgi:Arc/MetJ family transcription regulator